MNKIILCFLFTFLLFENLTSNEIIELKNQDKTGTTESIVAEKKIRLYYEGQGSFKYTSDNTNSLRLSLGYYDYPNTLIPYLPTEVDINQRPYETYDDNGVTKDIPVGSLEGQLKVSPSGAAIYTIPIYSVPGTKGVAPQVAIIYNSQSGNGIAGWGWNISGMSAISRSPKTKFIDNIEQNVQFNNLDEISHDGERFFHTDGSRGLQDAIYRPRTTNTSQLVLKNGDLSNGWFQLESKDLSIMEFGRSSNSKLHTEKGVLAWQLNKIKDQNGNYIEYKYLLSEGEMYVSEINYTGNENSGLLPYAKIKFNYKLRTADGNFSFSEGIKFNRTLILDEIIVSYESQTVRTYKLEYINDISSKLHRITVYGLNNTPMNSTVFEYEKEDSNPFSSFKSQPEFNQAIGTNNHEKIKTYFGDINGDGVADRIQVDTDLIIDGRRQTKWYLHHGNFLSKEDAGDILDNESKLRTGKLNYSDPTGGSFQFQTIGENEKYGTILYNQVLVMDFNRDGLDDILIPRLNRYNDCWNVLKGRKQAYEDLYLDIYLSNGDRLVFNRSYLINNNRLHGEDYAEVDESFYPADYDGDGDVELVITAHQSDHYVGNPFYPCTVTRNNNSGHYFNIYFLDFTNPDGTFKSSNEVNLSLKKQIDTGKDLLEHPEDYFVTPVQFVSDRAAELLVNNANQILKYENNNFNVSAQWTESSHWGAGITSEHDDFIQTGDYNGDGLTDFLFHYKKNNINEWSIRYSKGDGTFFGGMSNMGGQEPILISNLDKDKPLRNGGHYEDVWGNSWEVFWKPNPIISSIDANGDGKTDILVSELFKDTENDNYYYKITTYISKGNTIFEKNEFTTDSENWDFVDYNIEHIYGGIHRCSWSVNEFKPLDANGDGNLDIFIPNTRTFLTFNFEDNVNRLKNIYDGFNNKTEIKYLPLAYGENEVTNDILYLKDTDVKDSPLLNNTPSMYVVKEVNNYLSGDYNNIEKKTVYQYEDLIIHKDKGVLGFKKFTSAIEIENTGSSVTRKHEQVYELFVNTYDMLPQSNFVYLDNELISNQYFAYDIKPLTNSRYFLFERNNMSIDLLNSTFSMKTTLGNDIDDFQNIKKTTEEIFEYDYTFGHILSVFVGQETAVQRTIKEMYYTNKGSFCNNVPSYSITKQSRVEDGGIDDYEERRVDYDYYNSQYNYNLKSTISDPQQTKWKKNTFIYDQYFGNIISETVSQDEDSNLGDRTSSYIFDSKGRFIETTTNALNHSSYKSYNYYDGTLESETDVLGNTKTFDYDDFGKLVKSTTTTNQNPLTHQTSEIIFKWHNPSNTNEPNNTLFVKELKADNSPTTRIYYDAIGRKIASDKEVFEEGTGNKILRRDVEYYKEGRIYRETYPYEYVNSSSVPDGRYAVNVYDSKLRISEIIDNGKSTTTQFPDANNPYKTTFTSPSSQSTSKVTDYTGVLKQSIDNIGNKVNYKYNNSGNVIEISTVGLSTEDEHIVTTEYDIYGNKTKVIDPDTGGDFTYIYNAFGELRSQTTPNGTNTKKYDVLGRVTENSTPEGDILYTYYNSGNGIGQVHEISGPGSMKVTYEYDSYNRLKKKTELITGQSFVTELDYNYEGQVEFKTYPSGVKVEYIYDGIGTLYKLKRVDGSNSTIIWELKEIDEFGKTIEMDMANSDLTTTYDFDSDDMLTNIYTSNTNNQVLQDIDYDFDVNNSNLDSRIFNTVHQSESFLYDELNRLEKITIDNDIYDPNNSLKVINMTFYDDGSISEKDDVGDYYYDDNRDGTGDLMKPHHAVKKIDDTGDISDISIVNQDITYTSFNSISTIIEGSKKVILKYGNDLQRRKMEVYNNNVLQYSKYYLGDYEKIIYANNSTHEITYLSGGDGIISIVEKETGTPEEVYYILTDHIGSIVGLTDDNGDAINDARFSYDAWGRMRNPDDWTLHNISNNQKDYFNIMNRGFTGQEHLYDFKLINMNGRVYDPVLAQFIQPDNYVQFPEYAQSYNRFSYALNNPLKYTDPSGEILFSTVLAYAAYAYSAYSTVMSTINAYANGGGNAAINSLIMSGVQMGVSSFVGSAINEAGVKIFGETIKSDWAGLAFNVASAPLKGYLASGIVSGSSKYSWDAFGTSTAFAFGHGLLQMGAEAADLGGKPITSNPVNAYLYKDDNIYVVIYEVVNATKDYNQVRMYIFFDGGPSGKFKQIRVIQSITTNNPAYPMGPAHKKRANSYYNDPQGGPLKDNSPFLLSNVKGTGEDGHYDVMLEKLATVKNKEPLYEKFDHLYFDAPYRRQDAVYGNNDYTWEAELSWLGETNTGEWQLIRSMHYGFTVKNYTVTLMDPNYYLSPSEFSKTHRNYVNRVVD